MEEVDELDAMGVDAVVGMALYTGRMAMPGAPTVDSRPDSELPGELARAGWVQRHDR